MKDEVAMPPDPDNPCRRHDCHLCCLNTRMTLTESDVHRLEAAGHEGFARLNRSGDLELVNRDGACIFLEDGACRVYQIRPEGCRFYPFVVDLGSGAVLRDDECPHREEFQRNPDLVHELRASVVKEEAEAARRRSAR